MNTPICDFVRRYAESDALRLHMPGHKGKSMMRKAGSEVGLPTTGAEVKRSGHDVGEGGSENRSDGGAFSPEVYDITEIDGADSLYEADGIIRESEENAGRLFGAHTFYSTEGSSLCIRAMLYLTCLYAKENGKRPLIAVGRNAHKSFLSAAALLDLDVMWLYPKQAGSYLSCKIDARILVDFLESAEEKPTAVYLTSPDYLGNTVDIRSLAEICHRYGALLLVDNAHGAYLKFLPESEHPMDLGADMCCDSAHKTLPVLTGGAYLHVAKAAPKLFAAQAKSALALFGSTSPSYLILQSLDAANRYLACGYRERLSAFVEQVQSLKNRLVAHGYVLAADEPLKLTIDAKAYGYLGKQLAEILLENNIVCEFSDPDFTVMMFTPETGSEGMAQLETALLSIPKRPEITEKAPEFQLSEKVMSVREAYFSVNEVVSAAESAGRVLAVATVGCPPAVPIVASGELIDEVAVRCFRYYGIESCTVVKNVSY